LIRRIRKVPDMKTPFPMESHTSPAARRTPLARLLAALRGDKYVIDAYPPAVSPTKEG
jgi:hypothetical protein